MRINQWVKFKSTEELPLPKTVPEGSLGQIKSLNFCKKEGFHKVFSLDRGDVTIFHESQLEPVENDTAPV